MEEKKEYGVIHELGDYSKFGKLSEEESKKIQEQIIREQKENEDNKKN